MNEIDLEARRIWQLPEDQWRQELAALPIEKVLNNVRWRYRLAVGMRLKLAESMEPSGCVYYGWPLRSTKPQEETNENV